MSRLCVLIVIPAQAVESKTVVLYQAEEIYNADDLMVRAKAGVDELSQNTGFEVTVSPSMVADLTVRSGETYATSQLLKSELVDGKQIDTYVASVMNTYPVSESMSATRLSVTLTSKIYFTYDDDAARVQMRYTTATISGSGASRLVMTNGLKTSGIADYVSTSAQYSNPGGTYTLNRCASTWVSEATGFLHVNDRLYFDDGTYCQNDFHINRWGENLY